MNDRDDFEPSVRNAAWWASDTRQAALEIRRLHEVNIELLEALKELLRVESTHDDGEIILEVARHNARTAIAKATGETK
jgi:hypothetical protein